MAGGGYRKPESVWGYESAAGCYSEDPEVSKERIVNRMKEIFPEAGEKENFESHSLSRNEEEVVT